MDDLRALLDLLRPHHDTVREELIAANRKLDFLIRREIELNEKLERLIKMSDTNQARIDAANAALAAALDSIQTDVTAIADELKGAIPTPGAVPSQESIDTLNANVTRLQAVKAALDGLVVPPPATV